jgi:hypothetical protein
VDQKPLFGSSYAEEPLDSGTPSTAASTADDVDSPDARHKSAAAIAAAVRFGERESDDAKEDLPSLRQEIWRVGYKMYGIARFRIAVWQRRRENAATTS